MSWDYLYNSAISQQITVSSSVIKLFLSLLAGGLIGFNRERHKQPAGLRTHILICMGSALLMILSIYIPQTYFDFKNGDPGRIAAQVVSGIGFLGAGAIIRLGTNVRGLTTAASIWLISAVGLSIGAGLYIVALCVVVFALFTLVIIERLEHRFIPQLSIKTIVLEFSSNNFPDAQVKEVLKKMHIHLNDYNLSVFNSGKNLTELKMVVKIPEKTNLSELLDMFNHLETIKTVKIT
jgi:putative Mg2+ transporter-C (MgtC) family protein